MNPSQTLHPTDQALHAYGLGKLDDASAELVNNHLKSCSDCRRRVAELSSDRFLGRLGAPRGRPDGSGPIMSSTAGLSMLDVGAAGPTAPPPASSLPPGLADHPDYQITRELGRGGMGVVYLAQNTLMGRMEVLKVVGSHLIKRTGALERFLAEIRHAARLDHPNIVTAYSALRIGDSLVLAMQYVEGLDLTKIIQARGPLPIAHACNYAHQAALGLQHAHERGMVHRDIKPSNLMLARQSDRALIKVLDFGLAKVRSEGAIDAGLTHEGQMLGTPAYIAPEQIRDARGADIRADIYSLGCTLYYLLTGAPPFQGTSLYDILQAHHSMEAMPLNLKRPEVPVELAALVAKMMAKEPERRFQEPKQVARALTPFFKKGNLAFQSAAAEVSHAGQSSPSRPAPGIAVTLTEPITNDARPIAQQQRAVMPSAPATEWKSLIDPPGMERTRDETHAIAPTRRPRWLWSAVAGGLLALVFLAAWLGGVFKVETPHGVIPTNELATSPVAVTATTKSGFQDLFNGKNLTGWKPHAKQPGNWHVVDGVLVGSGPALSHLYTERGDFTDFHLRIEARFNKGGTSGVYVRCPFGPGLPSADDPKWPDGFQATINDARFLRDSTGGLLRSMDDKVYIYHAGEVTRVPSGKWFMMEVIADGKALSVLVDGQPSAYKFAPIALPSSGHIALQQYSAETVIEFRKIEIKELDHSNHDDPSGIGRVLGYTDRVARVAFSREGLGVLAGESTTEVTKKTGKPDIYWNRSYALRFWAVESGRNVFTMKGAGANVSALALSTDGRYCASSAALLNPIPILIWDLETGRSLHRLQRQDPIRELPCRALCFSPDDLRVMAALANGTVLAWDLATEREQPRITLDAGAPKRREFPIALFTSDRRHLITGSHAGLVELWDLASGGRLKGFAGHAGEVRTVACSADGRLILSAGSDNTVRLWDVASGKELRQLKSDERQVRCIAVSPDGRRGLSAGLDGPVHLWDLDSGSEVCRMEGHTMGVNSVAFSPDGRRAVSGGDDRTVRLWQLPDSGVAGGVRR